MEKLFNGIYKDKKVLVTGHTGFKGSWLVYWLAKLGAKIVGYSLTPPSNPNHFELIKNEINIDSIIGDIRNLDLLNEIFTKFQPDIVFHLAAQPIVRASYEDPITTYSTNVIGTLNVYEAARECGSVKAIVSITTDKVYENYEWVWGYRENDRLGGYDPYSASKACDEIMSISYRRSFFNLDKYKVTHNTLLATARAGNVIGGGDWAKDRLIPDIMKATSKNQPVVLRNPTSTRPWEHVLEPLSGYLLLGQKLLEGKKEFADAWNFGPYEEGALTVEEVVKFAQKFWNNISYTVRKNENDPHEAGLLKLDISKALNILKWKPTWNSQESIKYTVLWYKEYYNNNKILTSEQLIQFIEDAAKKEAIWTQS